MADKQILDAIRNRISIVNLVGESIPLKKAGRNFKGLCPFHHEKTPSFMVTEEKQIFHCFGCGTGGDVFTFLMKFNGLSFPEALKELAKRAGVKLPTLQNKGSRGSDEEMLRRKKWGLRLNELAKEHFVNNLKNREQGKPVLEYLRLRGLTPATIERHSLGLADNAWNSLYQELLAAKAPLSMAEELGLIRESQKEKGYYDFFRERLMFPILDHQGNGIGFGGRSLKPSDAAKYINSADSFLYNKSQTVYGLWFGKEAIRKQDALFLVEGYMDVLSLCQAGIENGVAPLGTALNADQIRLLRRYTKNFCLAFDGDAAGKKAALRTLPLFLEQQLTPRVLVLPEEMDPDSFIQKEGKEKWEALTKNTPTLFEFFIDETIAATGLQTDGILKAWEILRPIFQRVQNPLEANLYRKKIAEKLGVEEGWLKRTGPGTRDQGLGTKSKTAESQFPEEERLLIAAMVLKPELIPTIEKAAPTFCEPALKSLATQLFLQYAEEGNVPLASIQDQLEAGLARWIREMALVEEEEGIWKKAVQDCLSRMEQKSFGVRLKILNEKIAQAEQAGKEQELLQWMTQKTKLLQERQHDATRKRD